MQVTQKYYTKTQLMVYLGYNSIKSVSRFLASKNIPVINNRVDIEKVDKVLSGKR